MRVIQGLEHVDIDGPVCVTIGNFDGVHRGHRALLEATLERADETEATSVAITFEPHPVRFFRGDEYEPFRLTTPAQKIRLLERAGLDATLVLEFDAELAKMAPDEFVQSVFVERLEVRHVVVGWDFSFGRGRTGSIHDLERFGEQLGFGVTSLGPVLDDEVPVSSSRIRAALRAGDPEGASALLGHDFALAGRVVGGDERGREIGFPTANLDVDPEQLRPAQGIYVTTLVDHLDGAEPRRMPAVTSIGTRPTYYDDGAPTTVESFVLDAPDALDLYGHDIELALHTRLRPELAFDSTPELVAQIERDVSDARDWHGLGAPEAQGTTSSDSS